MGQATVVSGGADGDYVVTLDYGKQARDAALARIVARLAELVTTIAATQAMLDAQKAVDEEKKAAADAAIDHYVAATQAVPVASTAIKDAQVALQAISIDPGATPEEIAAAQALVTSSKAAYEAAQQAVKARLDDFTTAAKALLEQLRRSTALLLAMDLLKSEQTQLTKDEVYWEGLTLEESVQAWCTDLTEDATGTVATIEIPGESKIVLIAPGAPAPVPATDGILTAREVQTPEQVYFNAAILPGWQKYKPTYRRGTITAISTEVDTADVTLDEADTSSAQALVINQAPTLSAVPVQYMECNSGAFEVGDRCVVKFTDRDWAQPKIVGFVDNPKSCGPALRGVQASSLYPSGPSSSWLIRYGAAMPVEPKPASTYELHPGHITWVSPHFALASGAVELSWRGPDDRYSAITGWTAPTGGLINWSQTTFGVPTDVLHWKTGAPPGLAGALSNDYIDTAYVWINGGRVDTGIEKVIAAALHRPDPGLPDKVVLRVCSDSYPQRTGTRKLVTFDLVPADSLLEGVLVAGPLSGIVSATAFAILATYPAAQFSTAFNLPVTGTWVTRQRPHFNNRGDKLATCISWRDVPIADNAPRVVAASLDPATWAMLAYFGPPGTLTQTQTGYASWTYDPPAIPPRATTASAGYSRVITQQNSVLLGADFLDDDFVYVTLEHTFTQTTTADSAAELETSTSSETWAQAEQTDLSAVHSKHGLLAQRSYTVTASAVPAVLGGPSFTLNRTGPDRVVSWTNAHLAGDLSRNAFAVGMPVAALQTISYSGAAQADSSLIFATGVAATTTRQTVNYDVFLDGVLVAAGTNGSYAVADNAPVAATGSVSATRPLAVSVMESEIAPASYATTSEVAFNDLVGWVGALGAYPRHKHTAAHPARGAVYFGVGLQYELGGLELVAVKGAPGSPAEIQAVPAYIEGAGPTIALPVFGYRRGGGLTP